MGKWLGFEALGCMFSASSFVYWHSNWEPDSYMVKFCTGWYSNVMLDKYCTDTRLTRKDSEGDGAGLEEQRHITSRTRAKSRDDTSSSLTTQRMRVLGG